MSTCEVWFEFDRAERTYRPGETISGIVHVRVNKDCVCKKIFLRMAWRTHGKGNRNTGGKQEFAFVENASLTAGEDHRFPFIFSAPNGPLSYHGELVNIDWYLTASVDIPWARDPKAEEEFVLTGTAFPEEPLPELADEIEILAGPDEGIQAPRKKSRKLGLLLFFVPLVLFGIMAFTMFNGKGSSLFGFLPFLSIGVLIFGGIFASIWFAKKAAEKAGECEIEIARPHLRPGEIVTCDVRIAPPKPEEIEGVTCILRGREVAVSGSGTKKSTHRRTFHEQRQRLPGPFLTDPFQEIAAIFAMRVPADAPTTFMQSSNKVLWELQAVVEIAKWPDHKKLETLRVAVDP